MASMALTAQEVPENMEDLEPTPEVPALNLAEGCGWREANFEDVFVEGGGHGGSPPQFYDLETHGITFEHPRGYGVIGGVARGDEGNWALEGRVGGSALYGIWGEDGDLNVRFPPNGCAYGLDFSVQTRNNGLMIFTFNVQTPEGEQIVRRSQAQLQTSGVSSYHFVIPQGIFGMPLWTVTSFSIKFPAGAYGLDYVRWQVLADASATSAHVKKEKEALPEGTGWIEALIVNSCSSTEELLHTFEKLTDLALQGKIEENSKEKVVAVVRKVKDDGKLEWNRELSQSFGSLLRAIMGYTSPVKRSSPSGGKSA